MSTPAPSSDVAPSLVVEEGSASSPGSDVVAVASGASMNSTASSASDSSAKEANEPKPIVPTEVQANVLDALKVGKVPESWLWLTKYDQFFVGAFVAVFLMLSGYHWATLGGWGMQPIELDRLPERQYDFRIDINSASWVEWTQIEGIGEVTAQKIIDDRQANGPFRSVKDLLRVKGIGPKKLEMMRPFLREPDEQDSSAKSKP